MTAAILATILFSLSAVSGKRLSHHLSGVEVNFWRFLLSAFLLGAYAHSFGPGLGGGALGIFFISGIIGFGVGDYGLFRAYPVLGSRLTMVMTQCLAAPIAAMIEWLWLGKGLFFGQVLAGTLILAGVALALTPSETSEVKKKHWKAGILWGLMSAFGQGFGAVLSRKAGSMVVEGVTVDGLSAAYQRVLGGLTVMAILLAIRKFRIRNGGSIQTEVPLTPASVKLIIGLIVANALCGPTLGVGAYQWALNVDDLPAGIVLSVVALSPLVIIPFAMKFEGERPTVRSIIGSVIAVVGVIIMTHQVSQ
ncbi:MAG: DMT family transporter [Verrucomicrobiota bacterium]|jgi:drug/metabolite transporter (DMT)-like permease|nr:DMT family transporter [Verrucomicrobiota bacterium]